MPRTFTESELRGARWVWLLELTVAGRVFRFASTQCDVATDDGDYLAFRDGSFVPPYVEESWALSPESVTEFSLSLELVPSQGEDFASLVLGQGHRFSSGSGALSIWLPGTTYENRYALVQGASLESPEFGSSGESIRLTLQTSPVEDTAVFPPYSWTVTTERFPADSSTTALEHNYWVWRNDSSLGAVYPVIIGRPGIFTFPYGGSTFTVPASPAILLGNHTAAAAGDSGATFLIAGHHVGATEVTLVNLTDDLEETATVINGYDNTGQPIAYLRKEAWDDLGTVDFSAEYAVKWSEDGSFGLYSPFAPSKALNRLGDVAAWMLELSSLDVDRGRMLDVRQRRGQLVACYISEQVSPWKWVSDNILPIAEVAVQLSYRGIYLQPLDRYPEVSRHHVAHLIAGRDLHRISLVTEQPATANQASLGFAFNLQADVYARAVDVVADPNAFGLLRNSISYYSRTSFQRYGELDGGTSDTDLLSEPNGAAWSLLHLRIHREALPRFEVRYDAEPELAWIRPGARVTVTDSELHLVAQEAIVTARIWDGLGLSFELSIPDDPQLIAIGA